LPFDDIKSPVATHFYLNIVGNSKSNCFFL
jgi:hypothetical protein